MPDLLHKSHRQAAFQPTDEDADLEQFFTDAEQARQAFEKLVSAERLPKRLLIIYGVGGVGKSTLLKMYRLSCRRCHIPVALVGGEEAPSAAAVLADWATDLSEGKVKLPAFQSTLAHYRTLQVRVEAEGRKTGQAMAEKLGKAAASKAIEMAASMIPVIGPLIGAIGGAGAEALIDWLRGFLPKADLELYLDPTRRFTDDFLSDLTRIASRQRVVLMADTYEQMTTLGDWVRSLAQRLPENVLLVIAGRAAPDWERAWPGWMGKVQIIELKEMTPDDLRTLVRRYYAHIRGGEPAPKQVEAVVQFARGLPMAVTTAVRLWVKYGVEDFQVVRSQVVADLVDRLLEGVPQEMRPAFETVAVVRYFNADVLRALLDDGDADKLYAELRRWPFIRPRREGLAVHDAMREMMNEALRVRTPDRFRALHEQAATYYEKRLQTTGGDERECYMLERLYHRVYTNEETGIRLFQETAEELTRYQLVSRLRTLLNDVNTYPLGQENSRLWREYYNTRLAHIETQFTIAKQVYEAISENKQAEPKLQAYALCDLGRILQRSQYLLSNPLGIDHAIRQLTNTVERSLATAPLDEKLIINLESLIPAYVLQNSWSQARAVIAQMINYYAEKNIIWGLASAYFLLQWHYASIGDFRQMLAAHEAGRKAASPLLSLSFIKIRVLLSTVWIWIGRYAEVERNTREVLNALTEVHSMEYESQVKIDLAYALGTQEKYKEARPLLEQSLKIRREMGDEFFIAYWETFWGSILIQEGDFENAKAHLNHSLALKQKLKDRLDIPLTLSFLGKLYEVRRELNTSENYYRQSLHCRTGQNYFECMALTGLLRVKYAQGDYSAVPPLLAETEKLAQEYEYNDHLASLRLSQGHVAWDGHIPAWGSGFDAALRYYQQALIYALRYNRFLLDEALSGRPQGTPLWPIIPHCLEWGEEGQRMLATMHDWWRSGTNDIGTPRPDTISPLPEGIPLLDAERLAREREPGDGAQQRTVIEQIEAFAISHET